MRVIDFFEQAEKLPMANLPTITGGGGLVIVAPHPDDESLGCGGLIAAAVAVGVDVRLVVVSDGVGSHPNSRLYPPDTLLRLREEETRDAARALGLSSADICFLRLPDTAVPIEGLEADHACDTLAAAIMDCLATAVCVTWRFDPHCDHVAAAGLVDRVVGGKPGICVWHYPVWGWTLPSEHDVAGPPRGFRFHIGDYRAQKTEAIASHRSQITDLIDDDPEGFRLQPEMLSHFEKPFEIFFAVETRNQ
jgi:LmbE family N-acetylglucosaminyl deacetylase